MQKNLGSTDRIIRVIIGLAILGIGWGYHSWWGLVGLIPLATAGISRCPLYCPLRLSTTGKQG
ncbi:MAG: DUF2892 domain-containing protein [Acidobacteria bacterium]|nr:DUF2892 domain-containing protein [Acidobacteriota bacterium]